MIKALSYENRAVAILALAGGVSSIDLLSLNFLGPFVAADLHLSDTSLGLMGAIGLFAWSLAAIPAAILSDRLGKRKIFLVVGLSAFAVFSALTALAVSFLTLLLARALVGIAEGPVMPMQNAIMLDASSPHRRGLNMGIVQNLGAQLLGALAGPLLMVWIATHFGGWRNAFLIVGAPAIAMALLVHYGLREPVAKPDHAGTPPVTRVGEMIRVIVAVRNIRLCFLIGMGAIGWFAILLTFAPVWLVRVQHLSPAQMSAVMASLGAAGAVSAILVPWLSDRIGRRPAVTAFAMAGVIAPIGLLLVHGTLADCAVIFLGGLCSGVFPLFIAVIPMESVGGRNGATALAVVMGGAQIAGSFVGPVLGGMLSDAISPAAPLWLGAGLVALASLVSLFLVETAPGRQVEGFKNNNDRS